MKEKEINNVIVGFGKTGESVAEHCLRHDLLFAVADDSELSSRFKSFVTANGPRSFTALSNTEFSANDRLIISPGVPLTHPAIQQALLTGAELTNDIEMFSELRRQPMVMITGSNGKSTVTHFVGQLLNSVNVNAGVGGNIGTPCLDLLVKDYDAYVLEISSYQLELAKSSAADVAVLLNLSPDHLDRYDSVEAYYRAKTHIFGGCKIAVIKRGLGFDLGIEAGTQVITFGTDAPGDESSFGFREVQGRIYLARGEENLVAVDALSIKGKHNWLNLLSALAIADAIGGEMGVAMADLLAALPAVSGLPHRCEIVGASVSTIIVNDSKSTNPASTLSAIESFAEPAVNMALLLGGIGKGANFSVLKTCIEQNVSRCYVYGRDRDVIASQVGPMACVFETLDECLEDLRVAAKQPDVVLFSPACASQDQFNDFEARGEYFKSRAVELFR
ncbi:MAG: UDP-N-acetylmuramoylalanine--D-glutamate ligase [Candidatus Azotimanducaceae bacterium]|jgi:UDP-N-acetylmuramoylalanine--D-glutamate ligase